MKARLTTLLLLFAVATLGACGQTGPLYLPEELPEEQPKEQSEKPPAQAPEDARQTAPAEQPKPSETAETPE